MKNLLFLILTLFCFQLVQAKKTELSLNLKVGQTYTIKSVSVAAINQDVKGQSIAIDMEITGEMAFLITNKSAAGYDLDVRYTSLVMAMKTPQANMTFSSETPDADDPLSGMLSKMTDKSFQLTLSKKGEVQGVKNLDEIMNAAFDAIGDMPEAQKEQLKKQLSSSYGENAFRGNMGSMLTIFPAQPVEAGDSWTSSLKLEAGMVLNMDMVYIFIGEEDGYYLVSGEGTLATPEKGASIETNGMLMSFEMGGTMKSDLRIDKKTGWIAAGTVDQAIEGKTKIEGNSQMPDGMEIPMKMTTRTNYEGR